MKNRWLPPLAATIVAFAVFFSGMAYPWQLALLAAAAIGAFVYAALGTWARLHLLYRPSGLPGRHRAPREDRQRQHQQEVQGAAEDEAGEQQDHPRREQSAGQEEASSRGHGTARA